MDLTKTDSTFGGAYYYDKIGKPLKIYGHLTKNENEIELSEYDEKGDKTGIFLGTYNADNTFIGIWTNAKTNKVLPFSLSQLNSSSIASVALTHYRNENCRTRDSLLQIMKAEDIPFYQSSCSYIDIDLITIETPNKEVNALINNLILKNVCHDIGETQYANIPEYLESINNLTEDDINQMDVSCSINTNHNNILSVDISNGSYTGGAHPNSWSTTYNFDIRTGEVIKLKDILIDGGEEQLQKLAEKLFVKNNGREGWDFEEGKFPLAVNFSINTGGLYFFYNSYEIGSYVMGAPDVFIPYKDIKHLIKPNCIVANFILK
jgi:hypothetical protein